MVLSVVSLCQSFYCLPNKGGLFDQSPFWIEAMGTVIQAQAEKQAKEG